MSKGFKRLPNVMSQYFPVYHFTLCDMDSSLYEKSRGQDAILGELLQLLAGGETALNYSC